MYKKINIYITHRTKINLPMYLELNKFFNLFIYNLFKRRLAGRQPSLWQLLSARQ